MKMSNVRPDLKVLVLLVVVLAMTSCMLKERSVKWDKYQNDSINFKPYAEYAKPIITVKDVLNDTSSMDGDYRVHTYGQQGEYFGWLDNHEIIFSKLDKNNQDIVVGWNIDKDELFAYGAGEYFCFADGKIYKAIYTLDQKNNKEVTLYKGLLNQEKAFTFDKTIRAYNPKFECGDTPSPEIIRHLSTHLDDVVVALRPQHGFLVTAKRVQYPGKNYKVTVEQTKIVYYPNGREPVDIYMKPWWEGQLDAYYPFVNAYAFQNKVKGYRDSTMGAQLRYRMDEKGNVIGFATDDRSHATDSAYILTVDGKEHMVKVPTVFMLGYSVKGPYLTRRGVIWIGGSSLPNEGNGIYLAHGEEVKQLSKENVQSAKVSPNGCRLAYTTTHINFTGHISKPVLKVMDLCKGEQ